MKFYLIVRCTAIFTYVNLEPNSHQKISPFLSSAKHWRQRTPHLVPRIIFHKTRNERKAYTLVLAEQVSLFWLLVKIAWNPCMHAFMSVCSHNSVLFHAVYLSRAQEKQRHSACTYMYHEPNQNYHHHHRHPFIPPSSSSSSSCASRVPSHFHAFTVKKTFFSGNKGPFSLLFLVYLPGRGCVPCSRSSRRHMPLCSPLPFTLVSCYLALRLCHTKTVICWKHPRRQKRGILGISTTYMHHLVGNASLLARHVMMSL